MMSSLDGPNHSSHDKPMCLRSATQPAVSREAACAVQISSIKTRRCFQHRLTVGLTARGADAALLAHWLWRRVRRTLSLVTA